MTLKISQEIGFLLYARSLCKASTYPRPGVRLFWCSYSPVKCLEFETPCNIHTVLKVYVSQIKQFRQHVKELSDILIFKIMLKYTGAKT